MAATAAKVATGQAEPQILVEFAVLAVGQTLLLQLARRVLLEAQRVLARMDLFLPRLDLGLFRRRHR